MKEIRDFVKFIELWFGNSEATNTTQTLGNLQRSVQYQALKALADKPFEVTEQVVEVGLKTYFSEKFYNDISCNKGIRQDMKAALQAVFDHIRNATEKVSVPEEKQEPKRQTLLEWVRKEVVLFENQEFIIRLVIAGNLWK